MLPLVLLTSEGRLLFWSCIKQLYNKFNVLLQTINTSHIIIINNQWFSNQRSQLNFSQFTSNTLKQKIQTSHFYLFAKNIHVHYYYRVVILKPCYKICDVKAKIETWIRKAFSQRFVPWEWETLKRVTIQLTPWLFIFWHFTMACRPLFLFS